MSSGERTTRFPPALYVVLGVLLWSTGGLLIKLTTLNAFAVNAGRSLFAAITVAIFTYRNGLVFNRFVLLKSIIYAGTLSCFVYANKTTTAANAIFLQYTAPIYILVLAPFVLKEKFRSTDLLTVAMCIGGMALFFVDNSQTASAPNILVGNVVALISGLFFGLYILLLRHPATSHENPAVSVFYGNLLIVMIMLPLIAADPPQAMNLKDLAAILFLGIFQIGVSYLLFTTGVAAGVRSLDASIIGFIEPLFNPVWVFLFVGERPSKWAILGGATIILTVVVHTLLNSRSRLRIEPIE
jgi:DME family drug/metabolite transporter